MYINSSYQLALSTKLSAAALDGLFIGWRRRGKGSALGGGHTVPEAPCLASVSAGSGHDQCHQTPSSPPMVHTEEAREYGAARRAVFGSRSLSWQVQGVRIGARDDRRGIIE